VSKERFEDLEVRIAYQDQLLHELNEVVTRQQAAITALEQRCDLLVERIRAMGEAGADGAGDERPPHY
jgi:SlyX protein